MATVKLPEETAADARVGAVYADVEKNFRIPFRSNLLNGFPDGLGGESGIR